MREYVLTFLAAAAVTYLLTPLVRRFAIAIGAMHAARDRDVHVVPTPLLGGFAMYAGLAAGLVVASQLPALNSVFAETNMAKGLLLAGGLVVVMGFVDDRWGIGVISKLAGQVAAGVILVWSGAEVTWLPAPGGTILSLTSDQQIAVTILVVVVTINAVNFIDGLDGLAAGIVGIGAAAFFIYYYTLTHRLGLPDQTGPALASAILAGICVGFLPHNYHPARIFMGDTGAMLIGLLLAYAPIASLASLDPGSLTDYRAGAINRFGAILPLLLPAAILLIPYADLLMAVFRRTRAGMSPFAPDRKHLHHRMLDIGHSHRTSVLIMYLWAALFAGSVVWLSIIRTPLYVLAGVTAGAMLVLLFVSMPRLRPWARTPASAPPVGRSAAHATPTPARAAPTPAHGSPTPAHASSPAVRAPSSPVHTSPSPAVRAPSSPVHASPSPAAHTASPAVPGSPPAAHAQAPADSEAVPPAPPRRRAARPAVPATSRPRSSRSAGSSPLPSAPPTPQAAFHPAPPPDAASASGTGPAWGDLDPGQPVPPLAGPQQLPPPPPGGPQESSPPWPPAPPAPPAPFTWPQP
jgi:UDP-GlcNAc:undecaprenyl-phosphate/decaprenyl-phosphate GlcNAc-1-phosphate transferase